MRGGNLLRLARNGFVALRQMRFRDSERAMSRDRGSWGRWGNRLGGGSLAVRGPALRRGRRAACGTAARPVGNRWDGRRVGRANRAGRVSSARRRPWGGDVNAGGLWEARACSRCSRRSRMAMWGSCVMAMQDPACRSPSLHWCPGMVLSGVRQQRLILQRLQGFTRSALPDKPMASMSTRAISSLSIWASAMRARSRSRRAAVTFQFQNSGLPRGCLIWTSTCLVN